MLHHLSLAVADLDRSRRFYDAALGALGFVPVWSFPDAVGYGPPGGGDKLAIKLAEGPVPAPAPGFHVAFAARSRAHVDAFHLAGLEAGGRDAGPPGLRVQYGPEYYAAYLIDPDRHRVEAVSKG
ncbi:MAG: VOC family protein [Planctomycetota bacterium]